MILSLGGGFDEPLGVKVDASDNVYFVDTLNARVEKLDFADPPSLTFVSTAIGTVSSESPRTVTILNAGNNGCFAGNICEASCGCGAGAI
jgi:hypothetical protein